MKFKLLILSIIVSALHLSAQTDSIKPDTEPLNEGGCLVLKPETLDLGSISGDSIATGTFTVVNAGTEPVSIIKVYRDCNCTIPSYSRKPIAPGDSTQIKIKFNPEGYRWGTFRRTLRLKSTAENSSLTLVVRGSIRRPHKG